MFLSSLKSYAKKKVLGSKAVIGLVGSAVESLVCLCLETVAIGSVTFLVKECICPFDVLDVVLVDVGFNIAYVLFAMEHFRNHVHPFLKKPCQKVARKILGLDIRNPWEFMKIKYCIMCTMMMCMVLVVHNVVDMASFVHLTCFEILCIHVGVDVWTFRGRDITHYIETQLEPKPQVRILDARSVQSVPLCVEEPSPSVSLSSPKPDASRPGTPRMLSAMVVDDHFT